MTVTIPATAPEVDPTKPPPAEYLPDYDQFVTEDDAPVDNFFSEKQQRLLTEPLYSARVAERLGRPLLAAANVGRLHGVKGGGVRLQKRHKLFDAVARAGGYPSRFERFKPQVQCFLQFRSRLPDFESGVQHAVLLSGFEVESAIGCIVRVAVCCRWRSCGGCPKLSDSASTIRRTGWRGTAPGPWGWEGDKLRSRRSRRPHQASARSSFQAFRRPSLRWSAPALRWTRRSPARRG